MPVNNPFALVAGQQYADGTASSATNFTGTVAMSFNGTSIVGLRSDTNDNLLVTGTLTHNNAAPIADNFGVLPAVASSAAPTYNAGDQVLLSTDLAGNLRVNATFTGTATNNITQWNSVNLGSPTVYGTAPTGNVVIGVNAFVTNTVTVTGTVTANQGTSPWVVSLTSTTITGTVAVTQSTSPWVVSLTSTTVTNTVAENLTQVAGVSLGATAVTNFGAAPAAAAVPGVNASLFAGTTGITATGTSVNANITNTVPVTLTSPTITGTVAVTQSTSPWVVAGALTNNNAAPTATLIGVMDHIAETAYTTVTYTTGDVVLATTDLHGATNVDLQAYAGTALGAGSNYGTSPGAVNVMGVNAFITNTPAVTVSGTVGVTQSTSPWVVSLTSTTITGTVAVTQSTSPWVVAGALTNNNAAPTATLTGVLPAIASTAAPTYTTGDQVLLSTDLSGNLRVTFAAASEQNVNLNQWAGTNLGTPTTYGTSPGAVVAGSVNAFVTNTVAVTLASTTITGTVAVTQSTSPWVVSGTVTANAGTGTFTVGGPAASGAAVSGNPILNGGVFNTTQPTVTTGQIVDLQTTARGGLIVATGVDGFNVTNAGTFAVQVTGTVAVTQSTSPWVVSLASTTITGTVAVTQ